MGRSGHTLSPMSVTSPPSLLQRIGGYVALTKPRIIELLLVTTVPTMIVAEDGLPSLGLMAATVVGGTLAAGGANAANIEAEAEIILRPLMDHFEATLSSLSEWCEKTVMKRMLKVRQSTLSSFNPRTLLL